MDACLKAAIDAAPPSEWAAVAERAAAIDDPIVRGAAIFGWVSVHNQALPPAAAPALCGLLEAPEDGACRRRLESAHLRR